MQEEFILSHQGVSRNLVPAEALGATPSCLFQPPVVAGKAWHSLAGGSILLMSTSIFLGPSLLSPAILLFL